VQIRSKVFSDIWSYFLGVLALAASGMFISCSSSSGVDDYYTFNLSKSSNFSVTPALPLHQDISAPITITIDSSDLITSTTLRTTIPMIRSAKLTRLVFSNGAYPMSNFDTVSFIVSADSLNDQLLASYSSATDSVHYSNADFAAYLKKASLQYRIVFQANKAPAQPETISANAVLVLTAAPLQ
jgi:hypothetical protein